MTDAEGKPENPWPHRIACLLVALVFPLIWVGNLVTTTDAGMAVPDWPNTFGYNLFLYPYREWFFGPWDLFVEHGHRLLASLGGLVAIALVVVCYRGDDRRWVRYLSLFILGLFISQGVLGGARVIKDERVLAKLHGCVGPFIFAIVVFAAVATSRWWKSVSQDQYRSIGWVTRRLAVLMLLVSFIQLTLGAFVRHIDDLASPKQYVLLVALHIMTAVLLVLGTVWQFLLTRRSALIGAGVRSSINILMLLILAQFSLGVGTWVVKFGFPTWFDNQIWAASFVVPEKSFFQVNIVTAHAAIGSLILAFWAVHAARINRLSHSSAHKAIGAT